MKTVVMVVVVVVMKMTSAASLQNFCLNSTVLRTRTACHSCSISVLMACPSGYTHTPRSTAQDCRYFIRTPSLKLPISGCSFECYKETTVTQCCPGHWGRHCTECPDSADRPCSSRGVCSEGLGGNGTCSCQVGFAGTACEDCAPGRYGPTCSSECSCVHGLCDAGLTGVGSCTCFSGYTGANCDQELPECAALTCQPNSRCMEEALTGALGCHCLPGYQKSGTQCLSINPCLQRGLCHVQASCVHSGPNQHLCACNHGYHGDGRICTAVDPCQSQDGGCSVESARCVYDGPGKSHCECLLGFERLSAGGCSLRDACRPDSCHRNANCSTVAPGQVQCTCVPGYLGNGKVCYGNIMQRLNSLNTEPGGPWSGQLSNAITLFGSLSWPLQNLGPFTVFVPINKGFRGTSLKALTADSDKVKYLCKMHLVAGMMPLDSLRKSDVFYTLTGKSAETETSDGDSQVKLRIHGSRKRGGVLQADIIAANGMIHIINKVMDSVNPTVDSNTQENLMSIVSSYGKFNRFKTLLESAGLVSVLRLPGPLTVFAPVSSAFDEMGEGQLEYLSTTEGRNKLVELLRNHIVMSTSLEVFNAVSGLRLETAANQVLSLNVSQEGRLLVNGAAVLEAAVEAKNGRLYAVDAVLTPPSIEPVLPHRCDLTETAIIKGECVSCSAAKLQCSRGVYTGSSTFGCIYALSIGRSPVRIPATGCSPQCNVTVTTAACCSGFYGPDCRPCPGGHLRPCSGHGQCVGAIQGNGSCICQVNFGGSRCHLCSSTNKYGPNCDRTCPCVHGDCDNRPGSDGRCKPDSCLTGFTGPLCDRRTAPCGLQGRFCHAHADCDFSQGSTRCVCKPGYRGDGIICVESDPCAPPLRGGCSNNAKCIKLGPGTRSCQCLTGWTGDGDDCQPINNCDGGGGCHANATCIYVGPGQSDCSCKPGFRGDGRACEPLNECVSAAGGCHYLASCRLESSRWTCVCDAGYAGDGRTCYGSVEQELSVLPDASEFSTWTTESGFSWSLSDQNITVLLPSSAAVSKLSSEDKDFWTTKGNLPSLIRNHIVAGVFPSTSLSSTSSLTSLLKTALPVSTTNQLLTVGGATITTPDVAATNGLIHVIDQVLVPDRKLSEGLLATLALRPEFSLFRSYLMDYNLTEEIQRTGEFTVFAPTDAAIAAYLNETAATAMDVNTTRYHVVPAQRLLGAELQLGGHKQTLLGSSFQLSIAPRDGQLLVNGVPVVLSDLLSGGGVIHGLSSTLPVTRNRCDHATYHTVSGNCVDCLFPQDNVCPNSSVPNLSVRRRKCMLSRVFEGERLLTIGCRATCLTQTIERRCCPGFSGAQCERCPGPPAGPPCWGRGRCEDGRCLCSHGFNGTACQHCNHGKYSIHCDQDCLCKNGRCRDGPAGDGSCECDVGWRGVHCDDEIEDTDELCGGVKCHTSANCVIEVSGRRCLCAAGFQGNGTFCQASDPCVSGNGGCSSLAVCKRTQPGRRACVCSAGFSGDGLVCTEINPCLEGNGGCHANADCIHTGPNKTSCACSDGYTGDGQTCSMKDLCLKRNGGCHENAKCNTTAPGVRSCTCSRSFTGDGLTCRGTLGKEILRRKLRDFYLGLMMVDVSLKGRGPFTAFTPTASAFTADRNGHGRMKVLMADRDLEQFAAVLRGHVVMCHTLTAADLQRPRNLTALSGLTLSTRASQGRISVNGAAVTYSDAVSVNGVFHEIDHILFPLDTQPPAMNLSEVAERHGYKSFYKLLQDSGVLGQVSDVMFQPVTVFLPTDGAMAALPAEQRDFLLHRDHRDQLAEYLRFHILQGHKVYAEGLIHLDGVRTLQGSPLTFSCGGTDAIGEIFVNDGRCRVVQRHLVFPGGVAYGIDCLLTPPSLGGRCDHQTTFDLQMHCGLCTSSASRCPRGAKLKEVLKCDLPTMFVSRNSGCRSVCTVNFWQPKCCRGYHGRDCLVCPGGVASPCSNRGKCDDGHLGNGTCACDVGFEGVACERCSDGLYGPTCKACNCSEHGSCDSGRTGTGACFCDDGWTGERCESHTDEVFLCDPPCSPKAVCRENNTCECRPFYEGDGFTCTVVDLCRLWNGGCAGSAHCSQSGAQVSCTCPSGYHGDGFTCLPVDPCVAGDNGGCHQHATCTMTSPGKRRCSCKSDFVGDGLSCELRQLPVSRCLHGNGGCHHDAACTDLHAEDATLGVFHHRSVKGQYKLTFAAAKQSCTAEGGSLATYTQLSYAQQGGLNMCSAGWLEEARVAYPTTFSNPQCGFGHVGIVDYGTRKNQSETWDAFCYRMKEVKCECVSGFVGDGFSCTGNLLQVLESTPNFSNFLTQILNASRESEAGQLFMKRLSNLTVQSTLFVPDNSGLPGNQTLSLRDLEFHLSEGQALPLSRMRNSSSITTSVGELSVLGVTDLLDPSALSSRYINDRFITASDILASNGVIHVLQGPLRAPPPRQQVWLGLAGPGSGSGLGLSLGLGVLLLLGGASFVGYRFHTHNNKPFHFHYFKEEEEAPPAGGGRSISNPVYEAAPEPEPESNTCDITVEGGSYDS